MGLTSRASFSLQYELEVDQIDKSESAAGFLTQADVERLRFDEGVTTLHALRPSFSLDYRDNSAHPRRGWFTTARRVRAVARRRRRPASSSAPSPAPTSTRTC